jgi:hypothetical protein
MKVPFPLLSEVVLLQDLPLHSLKRGDVGVVVEHYAMTDLEEDGYSLEGFDVPNVTVEVSASQITSLQKWQKEMEILKKLDRLSVEKLIDVEAYLENLLTDAVQESQIS